MSKNKTTKKPKSVLEDVLEREPVSLHADQIVHAPWNPREEIRPEDVGDIAESIRSVGLLERLVVIRDSENEDMYIVIAGNRRLVACRAAGLDPIPCDLVTCSMEHAQRATLIENLQRKDVDPILEAGLIEKLVAGGMTEEEIAKETGRGNKWVWRRKQLNKLAEPWKNLVNHGRRFTVDCLERIASYTWEIQQEAAEAFENYAKSYNNEEQVSWRDIQREFTSRSRELKDATFPKNRCTKCPNNSANSPMLFECVQQNNGNPCKWGTCLDAKCFEKKMADMIEVAKKSAKDTGHKVKEVKHVCEVPESWSMKNKPDEEHKILYVYSDYIGIKRCGWGKERPKKEGKDAEIRKAENKAKKEKKNAIVCIGEWLGTNKAKDAVFAFVADGGSPMPEGSHLTSCEYLKIILLCSLFGTSFTFKVGLKEKAREVLLWAKEDGEKWPNDIMTGKELAEWASDFCGQVYDNLYDDKNVVRFLEIFGESVMECYPPGTFDVYLGNDAEKQDGNDDDTQEQE